MCFYAQIFIHIVLVRYVFYVIYRSFEDQPLFLPSDTLYARFLNSTSTGGLFGKCVNVTAGLLPSCPGLWFGTFLANILLLHIATAVPLDALPLQLQWRLFCEPLEYKQENIAVFRKDSFTRISNISNISGTSDNSAQLK